MTSTDRDRIWGILKTDSEQILTDKSAEYDGVINVHKQFHNASDDLNISSMQVAAVHLNKHIAAINAIVSGRHPGTQSLHERVVDALNFLRILDEMWTLDLMGGVLPPKAT